MVGGKELMNIQAILLLITQLISLILKLVTEIQNIQNLSESDKVALKKAVKRMRDKVAAITWDA